MANQVDVVDLLDNQLVCVLAWIWEEEVDHHFLAKGIYLARLVVLLVLVLFLEQQVLEVESRQDP